MREKLIELIRARIENRTWCVSELADYLIANGVVVTDKYVGGKEKLDFGTLTYGKEDREGQ